MKNVLTLIIVLLVCTSLSAQKSIQKKIQTQMIMAEDGATIEIEAGNFVMDKPLWLDGKKNITIRGAGMEKTILSFKGQKEGAEGIKVTNAENIVIENLTVQDTKGDAIKTQDVAGIQFIKVKTEWTGKPKKTNGAYGLYPVQCSNVLIDGCVAIGASDAGIYVGQSNYVIVRNCKAFKNVAGIEIENTRNADVYDNLAEGNTGGILVFDLPGLIQKKGGNVRVYNNITRKNNYKNFAPKGNTVGMVPPGTGIIVLATSDVEIFDNDIIENKTFGVAIASYYITETPIKDKEYDPYPARINIHNNKFQRSKQLPTLKNKLGLLAWLKFKRNVPDIAYDGIVNEDHLDAEGNMKADYQMCIRDNGDATFTNLDAANNFENLNKDLTPFNCNRDHLPVVKLNDSVTTESEKK